MRRRKEADHHAIIDELTQPNAPHPNAASLGVLYVNKSLTAAQASAIKAAMAAAAGVGGVDVLTAHYTPHHALAP